jgi:hypothetical protein
MEQRLQGRRDGTGSCRRCPAREGVAGAARSGVTRPEASTLTQSTPVRLARRENGASLGAHLAQAGRAAGARWGEKEHSFSRCPLRPEAGPFAARRTRGRDRRQARGWGGITPPEEGGASFVPPLFRNVGTFAPTKTPDIPEQWCAPPGPAPIRVTPERHAPGQRPCALGTHAPHLSRPASSGADAHPCTAVPCAVTRRSRGARVQRAMPPPAHGSVQQRVFLERNVPADSLRATVWALRRVPR